ncbi:MAG: MoaD/ThiS family protein [Leadbetterella sp.]
MLKIRCFGVCKDILGGTFYEVNSPDIKNVSELRTYLESQFPRLKDLASVKIAVNQEYADDAQVVQQQDEIVLIPPVSGG